MATAAGLLAIVALLAAMAMPASAAVGDPSLDSCLNAGTALGTCTELDNLAGARPEVLSPDGHQLYVATQQGAPYSGGSTQTAGVLIFTRDPQSGVLTFSNEVLSTASAPVDNPQDIVVSPDGANVYVSNAGTDTNHPSITEFTRGSDGSLTALGAVTSAVGWNQPHGMAISPDGGHLYVSGDDPATNTGTLLVFVRSGSGALTQATAPGGCFSEVTLTDCTRAKGIPNRSWQIAASPDGKNLYVTGEEDAYTYYAGQYCGMVDINGNCIQPGYSPHYVQAEGTLAVFGVAGDGSLSQPAVACLSDSGEDGGVPGGNFYTPGGSAPTPGVCQSVGAPLVGARSVTVSPDGHSVYVGSDKAIVAFSRASDGSLTAVAGPTGCVQTAGAGLANCTEASAVAGEYRLEVTSDGSQLIADSLVSSGSTGYGFFERNAGTGGLTERPGTAGCVTQDGTGHSGGTGGACTVNPAIGGYGFPVVSSDSVFVYLTGQSKGTLATYHLDVAPVCQDVSRSVTENTPTQIGVSCSDRNGDPLTLQVARNPFSGSLGAFDSGAQRVFYSPFANFVGTDSFTYTATGRGVTSAPATVTLTVVAPPPTASGSGSSASGTPGSGNQQQSQQQPSRTELDLAGAPRVNGLSVHLLLGCAQAPVSCAGTVGLTVTERLRGSRVLSVSARRRTVSRKVNVGRAAFTVTGGMIGPANVSLNAAGRRLLARYKRLRVHLTVTLSGGPVVASQTITFKQPKKKRRH